MGKLIYMGLLHFKRYVGGIGPKMPIYEYKCKSCKVRESIFFRSFSDVKDPKCSNCGSLDMTRLISSFTVVKGWGDFMKDMPAWDSMMDFNEDDPRDAARMLRQWKDEVGGDIGPQGEEMIARMDAGEMMSDLPDMGSDTNS